MKAESADLHQSQRICVHTEPFRPGEVKICIEQYNDKLGWYTAGCLRLPIHQLPSLEESVSRIKEHYWESTDEKIIPFSKLANHLETATH